MVEMEVESLGNASAMCGIEKGLKKGESADDLQREKAKNAELMKRISTLEAQIQEKNRESLLTNQQVSCPSPAERRCKRQKREIDNRGIGDGNGIETEMDSKAGNETPNVPPRVDENQEERLVNWMSTDEMHFSCFDKFRDGDIAGDHDDMDDSDEEDEYYEEDDSYIGHKDRESCSGDPSELKFANTSSLMKENREHDDTLRDIQVPLDQSNPKHDKKEQEKPAGMSPSGEEPCQMVLSINTSWNKKPRKVPFCPKEINKILESDALLSTNAQSHTTRKIIVFASLGIRHGCEDMYELDFNHFSVLRKGDPYVSPKNPGEHVLYENPGIQRKVFYPNRCNPTLCPVQILEEEKAMRPSDPSCPSCLFLCIKYGGRTRNLPQNEYVRQQMGRNKLKSFGPIMCRMAMLVHIRSGSFFFKALGITLLFMAGLPDDLVQRETKYRNLDLLQKYYRTDKDAEGEELFLSHSAVFDTPRTFKTTSTKTKGKKQTNLSSKSHKLPRASHQQLAPSSLTHTSTQFGLMGYTTSIQTHAMAEAFQTSPSRVSNTTTTSFGNNISYHNQTPYHLFPPQPANSFIPMVFWPPSNLYPPGPYPTTYNYQPSFPTNVNYVNIHTRPYYNHPSSSCFTPKIIEGDNRKSVSGSTERDSDSDSSSSSMEESKEALASCR